VLSKKEEIFTVFFEGYINYSLNMVREHRMGDKCMRFAALLLRLGFVSPCIIIYSNKSTN
jgi:hypothetical protein